MIRNNNGKVIRKIAQAKMKSNKGRYWILLITIAMTAILLTGTLTVGASYIKSIEYTTMRQVGTKAQGGYKYLTPEQYAKLQGHPSIKKQGYMQTIGDIEDVSFKSRMQQVFYMDEQAVDFSFMLPLVKGKIPEKDDEVLVSTLTLDMLNLPYDVGIQIHVNLNMDGVIQPVTWTVSGIYEGDHLAMVDTWSVSKPLANKLLKGKEIDYEPNHLKYAGLIQMGVMLNQTHNIDIDNRLKQIAEEQGVNISDSQISVNWAYMTSQINGAEMIAFIILMLLLILSGYLVIYNIFYIGIIYDIQFFGMLKTIGCTKRQVKTIVISQALKLTIRAIPIGLLFGYVIGRVMTTRIIGSLNVSEITYSIHPLIFVGSTLLTIITVYIGARKPANMAGKVSPIEATKMIGFEQNKRLNKPINRGKKRRFSIWTMAKENVMRYKKKMGIVVLSITISLVLLQTITTAASSLDQDAMIDNMIMGDYTIASPQFFDYSYNYSRDAMDEDILDSIADRKGVAVNKVYGMNVFIHPSERLVEKAHIDEETTSVSDNELLNGKQMIDLYAIEEGSYSYLQALIIEGELDIEKFKEGKGIVISKEIPNYQKEERYDDIYNIGDILQIPDEEGRQHDYEILAFVGEMPYYLYDGNGHDYGMNVYMSDKAIKIHNTGMPVMLASLEVSEEHRTEIASFLDSISHAHPEFAYKSRLDYIEDMTGYQVMMKMVGYSLGGLLGIIGIFNFINTCISGILSRKQELAMLQSIGMTSRQLLTMLILESGFIAIISIGLSFIIGGILSRIVGGWVMFSTGSICFTPLLVISPLIMIILPLVPIITYNNLNKSSLVERIKVVN